MSDIDEIPDSGAKACILYYRHTPDGQASKTGKPLLMVVMHFTRLRTFIREDWEEIVDDADVEYISCLIEKIQAFLHFPIEEGFLAVAKLGEGVAYSSETFRVGGSETEWTELFSTILEAGETGNSLPSSISMSYGSPA